MATLSKAEKWANWKTMWPQYISKLKAKQGRPRSHKGIRADMIAKGISVEGSKPALTTAQPVPPIPIMGFSPDVAPEKYIPSPKSPPIEVAPVTPPVEKQLPPPTPIPETTPVGYNPWLAERKRAGIRPLTPRERRQPRPRTPREGKRGR